MPSLLPVYKRIDITFERGEGCWLYDKAGRRWLDFTSGIAVNGLGHAHPHLVKAVQEQAAKLWHVSNLFRIESLEKLADRLVAMSFADTVFVCNSGAEAVEGCIKVARRFHWANGRPERNRLVTFEGAFHGRTMAAISAAGGAKMVDGFGPLLDGFDRVPFDDEAALRGAITERTAGILVEPIQGEGGIRPLTIERLRLLRSLCDEHGLLLIFDEVQCGLGRTGKMFAHEWAGITPDLMSLAKGLGGGFPIGAVLATARAASGMDTSTHGSTFGGNPLATTVANAVLDVMLAPGFLDQVKARGELLHGRLGEIAARNPGRIAEIRGQGLLVGIKTVEPNLEVAARLREAGLLTVPASDNIVRFLPALTVSEDEIAQACEIFEAVLAAQPAAA
ncbi:MAG TPA: aspartate aminotransferase family protein [Geminicoccaceae bacterium]|nr:aspartate aminotransferase family protein [Geminicoccus sp.]HMU50471.1 aspartate aminotransferase family protein [Geminicoccaceae bacterium]